METPTHKLRDREIYLNLFLVQPMPVAPSVTVSTQREVWACLGVFVPRSILVFFLFFDEEMLLNQSLTFNN